MTAARVEIRAAAEMRAAGRKLEGLAAVYDQPTKVGTFTEVIRRSAFASTLAGGADVLFLANHAWEHVIGRTRSGTLKLWQTERGLAFSVDLPETTAARDLLALAERGDLGGASVGMRVRLDEWRGETRAILDAELVEISAVASHAAYPTTEIVARSRTPGRAADLFCARHSAAALRRRLEAL